MKKNEDNIFHAICKAEGMDRDEAIKNISSQKHKYVIIRQMFIYFLYKKCKYTKKRAGLIFKQRHQTAMHSIKTIENLKETSEIYRVRINKAMRAAKKISKL